MGHWNLPWNLNNCDCPYAMQIYCVTVPDCMNTYRPHSWTTWFGQKLSNEGDVCPCAMELFASTPNNVWIFLSFLSGAQKGNGKRAVPCPSPAKWRGKGIFVYPNRLLIFVWCVRKTAQYSSCSSCRYVGWLPLCQERLPSRLIWAYN